MKIAMIASPRFPISEPFAGGLEAQIWHTSAALTARGAQVDLYGAEGSDFAAPGLSFPLPDWTTHEQHATDTTLPPHTARMHEQRMHELIDRLAHNADGYDIVHNQCLYPEPLARASELPVPMVTTLHTPPFWELTEVLDGANGDFVAVSHHVAQSWTTLSPSPRVIHNGIDLSRWMPGRGGPDLAWFGRLVPEKAPHLAIDVARTLGRRIHIAGRVGDEVYFEREIRPRLGADVILAGELTQSRLADLIGRCGVVLVTPMWPEPFGLVAAEAAACGTPVVAFDAGGLREVVHEGVTGFVVPQGDVIAMADAVAHAANLDRVRAATEARRRFSVTAMVERYLAVYDDLIARRTQASA